jgi:hypothetical protein
VTAAGSLKLFALPVMSLAVAGGRSRYGRCTLMLHGVSHSGEMI